MQLNNINPKKFPYGKPSKSLRKAIIWLNRRKKTFNKIDEFFEYPNYWNLPKTIVCRLTTDDIDFIQNSTYFWQVGL